MLGRHVHRGAPVYDGFILRSAAARLGVRRIEPGRTLGSASGSRGAHAVEFSKTVAPSREGDSFVRGRARRAWLARERTEQYSAMVLAEEAAAWRSRRRFARRGGSIGVGAPAERARCRSGARRRRRKWRLPTCSDAPRRGARRATSSVVGPERLAVELHAALGQQPPGLRARARRTPRRSPPAGGPARRRPDRRRVGDLVGHARARRTRGRSAASAARRPPPSPWKRATIARASARLASRGPVPSGGRSTASSVEPLRPSPRRAAASSCRTSPRAAR